MVNVHDATRVALDAGLLIAGTSYVDGRFSMKPKGGMDPVTAVLTPTAYHYALRDTVNSFLSPTMWGKLAETQVRALFYAAVAYSRGGATPMANAIIAGITGEAGGLTDAVILDNLGL